MVWVQVTGDAVRGVTAWWVKRRCHPPRCRLAVKKFTELGSSFLPMRLVPFPFRDVDEIGDKSAAFIESWMRCTAPCLARDETASSQRKGGERMGAGCPPWRSLLMANPSLPIYSFSSATLRRGMPGVCPSFQIHSFPNKLCIPAASPDPHPPVVQLALPFGPMLPGAAAAAAVRTPGLL